MPAAAERLTVVLSVKRPCWVSASVDGERQIERLLQPGERQTIEVRREMVITAGDASAIALTLNGADAKPLGKTGEVGHRPFQPHQLQRLRAGALMSWPDAAARSVQARRGAIARCALQAAPARWRRARTSSWRSSCCCSRIAIPRSAPPPTRRSNRIPESSLRAFLARSDVPVDLREFFADRGIFPDEIPQIEFEAEIDEPLIDTDPVATDAEIADRRRQTRQSGVQALVTMSFPQRLKAAMKGSREVRAVLIRDPEQADRRRRC